MSMEILPSSTPAELAKRMREAFERIPRVPPREHFIRMVREGRINARGQLTKLFGGQAKPEPNRETWMPEDASANGKPAE